MSITMRKAIARCTAAFATVLVAFGVAGSPAQAAEIVPYGNTTDTWYYMLLDVEGNGPLCGTAEREKQDTSPVYIRVDNLYYGLDTCHLLAQGRLAYNWGDWTNYTVNGFAILPGVGSFNIKSDIYESGCRSARILAVRSSNAGRFDGVWSPDSLYSYTVINNGWI